MTTRPNASREIAAVLWVVQVALALWFRMAGESGLTVSAEALAAHVPTLIELLRFIGVAEMLEALWRILRFWVSALVG